MRIFNLKTISAKLSIWIIGAFLLIFCITMSYIVFETRQKTIELTKMYTNEMLAKQAKSISITMNKEMDVARVLSRSFINYEGIPKERLRTIYDQIIEEVFDLHPEYLSIWVSYELYYFDSAWDKRYGRARTEVYRLDGKKIVKKDSVNLDGDIPGSNYYITKNRNKEKINDPYYYSFTGNKNDEILMTSVSSPIQRNKEFAGVVGIDFRLDNYAELTQNIKYGDNSYAFLVSNNATIISHPNEEYVGTNLTDFINDPEEKKNLLEKIKQGVSFNYTRVNKTTGSSYVTYAPIQIGQTEMPWSLAISIPYETILSKANQLTRISILIGLLSIVILTIIIWYFTSSISRPLKKVTQNIQELADTGNISKKMSINIERNDEIGRMHKAVKKLINSLQITSKYALEIGRGNYDVPFKPLSNEDTLGNVLIDMKERFIQKEQESIKRQEKDEQQKWISQGVSLFNDVLRQDHADTQELSYALVKNLVKYTKSSVGGLFLLEESEEGNSQKELLELKASYAYDRRKYINKKIHLGEGLVGACFLEKKSIHLKKIPDNYIEITSGLGNSMPKVVFITPLIYNEKVMGVIELATLKSYERYEVEFIEKVAENIAATISSVKINERTNQLLRQSQEQSEQMKAQEEEMRQNMEELQATQEEMERKNQEIENVMNGIGKALSIIEYNTSGKIKDVNESLTKLINKNRDELIQKTQQEVIHKTNEDNFEFESFWNDLNAGKTKNAIFQYIDNANEKEIWTNETITPIYNKSGDIEYFLDFVVDITEQKKLENEISVQLNKSKERENYVKEMLNELEATQNEMNKKDIERKGVLDALNNSTNMVEYDLQGNITFVNDAYLNLIDMQKEEVLGQHYNYKRTLTENENKDSQKFWEDLRNGQTKREINNFIVKNKSIWLLETYTPIYNSNNQPYKILKIALDITESKNLEHQLLQQTEELKTQEEEIKQSLEEVTAMQNEMDRCKRESESLTDKLEVKSVKLKTTEERLKETKAMMEAKEAAYKKEIARLKEKLSEK